MNSYQNNHDQNLIFENLTIFERILNLEISNDYNNIAVSGGGLDEYIEKNIVYFVPIIRILEDKFGKRPLYSNANNKLRKLFCDRFIKEIFNFKKNNLTETKITNNQSLTKSTTKTNKELTLKSDINDIAASYQEAIIDTLFSKLKLVLNNNMINKISIVGGVSINERFREKAKIFEIDNNVAIMFPDNQFCTDNAAMIAMAGYLKYNNSSFSSLEIVPSPRLSFN